MLLAKKDSDEQVLLAEDQAWMESSSDSDQEISANMVFMYKMEKVLFDSEESSSYAKETIAEVSYYSSDFESESEYKTSDYYDNFTNYGLFVDNNDDQEIFQDAIESASENFNENHIVSQKDHDELEKRIEKANQQNKDLENQNKDLQDKYDVLQNQVNPFEVKNNELNEQIKVLNEKNDDLLAQIDVLQEQLKVKHVVIDTHTKNQNKDLQDKYDVLQNQVNTFEVKNNELNEKKVLNEKNDDLLAQTEVLQEQLKVKHVVIDTYTECQTQYAKLEEERYQYMISYFALCDNDKQHRKRIDEQDILFDKISCQLVEMNNNVLRLQEKILEKETKISELEECDKLYNGRKGIGFENPSYFCKAIKLRPSLYDERVIGLGYTLMFLTHSNEALEIDKFKRERENKIEFAYDYGNLNATNKFTQTICSNSDFKKIIIDLEDEVVSLLEKEKENLEIIESLKSKGSESSENAISKSGIQSENDCHVVEKGCDNLENSKVIAQGIFKINVSQSVSPISAYKTSCASNNVENKTKIKRRKRTSSKQNDKQVNNDVLRANRDFVHFSDLDTLSSVRRPKHSGAI
ncbi:hypothetical protein Tco_1085362 [Tanacetum coccineum]